MESIKCCPEAAAALCRSRTSFLAGAVFCLRDEVPAPAAPAVREAALLVFSDLSALDLPVLGWVSPDPAEDPAVLEQACFAVLYCGGDAFYRFFPGFAG